MGGASWGQGGPEPSGPQNRLGAALGLRCLPCGSGGWVGWACGRKVGTKSVHSSPEDAGRGWGGGHRGVPSAALVELRPLPQSRDSGRGPWLAAGNHLPMRARGQAGWASWLVSEGCAWGGPPVKDPLPASLGLGCPQLLVWDMPAGIRIPGE